MSATDQKIIPNLWFDDQAAEAASFYTDLFPDSRLGAVTRYGSEGFEIHGRPEGTVMTVDFELAGYRLTALNGGPHFRFTPAISFFVTCESAADVDRVWASLVEGGTPRMELGAYAWSERYGWVDDRYGLSWQVALGDPAEVGARVAPSLLFVGDQHGRAEEAVNVYTSIFEPSSVAGVLRYGPDEGEPEGTVKHAQFTLQGQPFMAMDSTLDHLFTFNEAVSLLVECASQEEVDRYWERLTEGGDPGAQQCGWLKDRFGVSWQVSPLELHRMLQDEDPERVARATRSVLGMKKLELPALREAFEGSPAGGRVS